ncbi:MAG: ribonuclease III [Bacteroidaceae bacterium]|nr:ribonuclease III [Bacteroidaceae bacterium]
MIDILDRIRLPFRKDRESYLRLYDILGFYPHNISHYKRALIHKSASMDKNSRTKRLENNERLEFLGDAILGAIVGDIVFQHFEGKREGFLTNARSKVVQRETLNRIAKEIGLVEMIHAAIVPNATHNSHLGGNAFEALIGAIYLDRGYHACMKFMKKRILKDYIDLNKMAYKEQNFKSKLIEWSQKNRVEAVFESTEQHEGNGSPTFVSCVRIEGVAIGKGKGYSKKESQQNAARESLALLKKRPQLVEQIFAAKSKRTAMEEEPRTVVDVELSAKEAAPQKAQTKRPVEKKGDKPAAKESKPVRTDSENPVPDVPHDEEMDLSNISLKRKELTRDEIIAAAEDAAFQGEREA